MTFTDLGRGHMSDSDTDTDNDTTTDEGEDLLENGVDTDERAGRSLGNDE